MAPVVSVPVWNEAEKASPTLLDACKRGDIDLARRLLGTAKANISFRTKREVSIHDCTHTNTATSDTTEHNREEPRTPRQADEYEHAGVDRSLLADGGMGEMRQDDEQTSLNIDAQDENGMTCLHWACDRGHPDIVRALVEKCADVGVTDNDGQSALHYAAFCGHLDVVRVLLWAGADREIEDNHGQTALDCADDFPDIMELLGSSRHSSLLAEK
ncbi:hypothetical protein SARC_04360 [Sphaeroforma arctica JP610]|uniref:Uncharacterized protein n=1 Tax=Sphaeroforma arctica JP610 TaxID=667725 RepID=A0A0L0G3E5_9EUKA|nr:hypothetical protein SARC_04360 [Sphaeroforma arctica JP610]KNC83394.1 hypothetical protein SARC_04360 [Sphaeroforma arctica JP610]|eukprot:XP_014157296.1 hypothetical protein SARC_04360 [Sphaeroforma arctica JP610]